ncbi:hypothetical protein FGB62_6g337 [Gracilaria domingensis]|nr:hypothetical protein FGB62_6g337 [Gracilaria domingensis]
MTTRVSRGWGRRRAGRAPVLSERARNAPALCGRRDARGAHAGAARAERGGQRRHVGGKVLERRTVEPRSAAVRHARPAGRLRRVRRGGASGQHRAAAAGAARVVRRGRGGVRRNPRAAAARRRRARGAAAVGGVLLRRAGQDAGRKGAHELRAAGAVPGDGLRVGAAAVGPRGGARRAQRAAVLRRVRAHVARVLALRDAQARRAAAVLTARRAPSKKCPQRVQRGHRAVRAVISRRPHPPPPPPLLRRVLCS